MNSQIESVIPLDGNEPTDRNFCAVLTPAGRGAVAVVALKGPLAETTLDDHFCSASGITLCNNPQRQIFYGRWMPTKEDVVVVRSVSGVFEVNCHGGLTASASILRNLQQSGFEVLDQVAWIEMLAPGIWRAELTQAMLKSMSDKTAEILLQQYLNLDDRLAEIEQLIIESPNLANEKLIEMSSWSGFGSHLTTPWTVVFAGPPNVGKSSLMNAIVGFDRAIVHNIAGTTRDVVTHVTAVNGWPIEIKDTAGLRRSDSSIEKIGIDIARTVIEQADLLVLVYDASQERQSELPLPQRNPEIVVANKIDLVDERRPTGIPNAISTSAKTGQGIEHLMNDISDKLVKEPPPAELLIPVNARQVELVKNVSELLINDQAAQAIEVWRQSV